jgi:hypothetical protein
MPTYFHTPIRERPEEVAQTQLRAQYFTYLRRLYIAIDKLLRRNGHIHTSTAALLALDEIFSKLQLFNSLAREAQITYLLRIQT